MTTTGRQTRRPFTISAMHPSAALALAGAGLVSALLVAVMWR
ncbi:MAG TPA: hypothetical protein VGL58_17900 [Caulobacteraceae bacterium]|jgi:hypothetical protein